MAPRVITHRTISQPAWWLFGAGLAFAAWWGLPLIESERLENQFFGLFWYSMLGLGAVSWAVTVEQRVSATSVERRYGLLGLFVLWRQSHPVSNFSAITLEQEPGLFGRDSVWLQLQGKNGTPFVFARYRATDKQIEAARSRASELSQLTGLPFATEGQSGG